MPRGSSRSSRGRGSSARRWRPIVPFTAVPFAVVLLAALFFAALLPFGRAARAEVPEAAPTRSVWAAPSYQVLLTDAFEPSSRHGLGAALAYAFHVSPTFNLGMTLAYRLYPGAVSTQQLGYGVLLQHFFSADWARADGLYPYVDYGLLLQQTFIEARRGSAVSHDTRLGLGALLRVGGVPLFLSVAGHYSRLSYFDIDSTWVPYAEAQLGWVHAF